MSDVRSMSDLRRHLRRFRTVDITTIGRRSGRPARIEIWWFDIDDRFYITGTPGPRDWMANLRADPRITVHVDGLDIEASAVEVQDPGVRRRVMTHPDTSWYSTQADLERLIAESPMVEIRFRSSSGRQLS